MRIKTALSRGLRRRTTRPRAPAGGAFMIMARIRSYLHKTGHDHETEASWRRRERDGTGWTAIVMSPAELVSRGGVACHREKEHQWRFSMAYAAELDSGGGWARSR